MKWYEMVKVPVEPLLSTQWFVRTEPLAARCLEALDRGEPKFIPSRWEKVQKSTCAQPNLRLVGQFSTAEGKRCLSLLPFSRFEVKTAGGKSCFAELGTKNSREPTLAGDTRSKVGSRLYRRIFQQVFFFSLFLFFYLHNQVYSVLRTGERDLSVPHCEHGRKNQTFKKSREEDNASSTRSKATGR